MPDTAEEKWETAVDATAIPDGVTAQQLWAWLTAKGGIGPGGRHQYMRLLRAVPHAAITITAGTPTVTVTSAEGVLDGND